MRDCLKGIAGISVEYPLLLCPPGEAYSGCVEVVTLLGGNFHPHLDETYLVLPAARRDLLRVCQALQMIGHWLLGGFW